MNEYYDELPEMFDPTTHEGTRDLVPIPIGWYLAQIVESEVRQAQTGNGSFLLAVFEILEGEHRGRKVYQNVTLQNMSQQAVEIGQRLLTDIYTAAGVTTPTKDIRVILFKPLKTRVGIKRDPSGEWPDRNIVTSVRLPNYEPKRGPGGAPAKAVPPTIPTPSSAAPQGDAPWRS